MSEMKTQSSMQNISQLREITGAGIMDCKKALIACAGDIDKATGWLRTQGIVKAAKKKDSREAKEGLVGCFVGNNKGVLIQFHCETDFVSRGDVFQSLVKKVGQFALKENLKDVPSILSRQIDQEPMEDMINACSANVGERIDLSHVEFVSAEEDDSLHLSSYVHMSKGDAHASFGKMAVFVLLKSKGSKEQVQKIGKNIAMHIAAQKPRYAKEEDVSEKVMAEERALQKASKDLVGKPEKVAESMVRGRLNKFLKEIVLENQDYVMDSSKTIKSFLTETSKELGEKVEVVDFFCLPKIKDE